MESVVLGLLAFLSGLKISTARTAGEQYAAHDTTSDQSGFRNGFMISRRASRLLVLTCFFLSIMLFIDARKIQTLQAQSKFRTITSASISQISVRMASYSQLLVGAAAHVAASGNPDADVLESYVSNLDLAENYPGIVFVDFITAKDGMNIPGQRTVSDLSESQSGLGNARQAALDRARQSKQTTLAPYAIVDINGRKSADFLLARAVFAAVDTGQDEIFVGWVIAPFDAAMPIAGDDMRANSRYHLTAFSDASGAPDTTVYASGGSVAAQGRFGESYRVDLYGRVWLLQYISTPLFDAQYDSYIPQVLLASGLLLTALVSLALKSKTQYSRRLRTVAELRTRQLDARENENRALIESKVSVVVVVNSDGRITFANDAAATLFQCTRECFADVSFDAFVQLKTDHADVEFYNAIGFLPDDGRLLLDVQANAWRTEDGAEYRTIMIRDVTEQINARVSIERLHYRYNVALNGAGIGVFEIDTKGGKAEMSETWHRIMGTDQLDEPFEHRKHFTARIHPDDLPVLQKADRACIAGDALRSVAEYRVQFDDGWRWMYSDAVLVPATQRRDAPRLIGTQFDITDLRHARDALKLSEARFRMVLEDAPVGMAVMDEKGVFTGVNAALTTLCGHEQSALEQGMRLADLLSRKDFVQMSRDIRALLTSGVAKTYHNQFRLRTRSGELRWGLFNFSWIYDDSRDGNVYIVQIVDISDQKRVEKIKSEFVATVSHELRTPLTSIKGALSLLEGTAMQNMPDTSKRLLEIASVNADRLTTLVNDILDLEKISSGDIPFECEEVSLLQIVGHTIDQMQETARAHENTLVVLNRPEDLMVHVDAVRLQQVLVNLVSNACKFSDPDTPVTVRCERSGSEAIVYVINTGPPVPESFQGAVFDAFTQADASDTRSKGGTGLGLNIAQHIIKRSGGRIGFHETGDRQIEFWFTCPLAPSDVPAGDAGFAAPSEARAGKLVTRKAV